MRHNEVLLEKLTMFPRISALALVLLMDGAGLAASPKEIKLGLDEWPPFASKTIPDFGLSAEIITQAFESQGYKVVLTILPWGRIEQEIKQLKLDVMGNLYEIDEIKKYAHYSEPYYKSSVKFLASPHFRGTINTLEDAKTYSIGYGNGYSFGEVFDKAHYLRKTTCPLTINCIRMLSAGRLDLVVDSQEVLLYQLQKNPKFHADGLQVLPFTLITNNMAIGVSKKHPTHKELINDFNRGLDQLKKSMKSSKNILAPSVPNRA
jgi:polar amino acid transport system substrate-binding protein